MTKVIHFLHHNNHYICNIGGKVDKNRITLEWDKVTCKKCLKQQIFDDTDDEVYY